MQFAQEKNAIIWLITPVGDLALVGWVGMGRRSTPVAESTDLEVPVSWEGPTPPTPLGSILEPEESRVWVFPTPATEILRQRLGMTGFTCDPGGSLALFHASVSLSDNESGVGGSL